MALYDYMCDACEAGFETSHGMTEKPTVKCPECGSKKTHKVPSLPNIAVHATSAKRAENDRDNRRKDIHSDLSENYGVEKIQPLAGNTLESAYNEIKETGTMTRDKMQAKKETDAKKLKTKQRGWMEKALKRSPGRAKEKKNHKDATAAKKRAISI